MSCFISAVVANTRVVVRNVTEQHVSRDPELEVDETLKYPALERSNAKIEMPNQTLDWSNSDGNTMRGESTASVWNCGLNSPLEMAFGTDGVPQATKEGPFTSEDRNGNYNESSDGHDVAKQREVK